MRVAVQSGRCAVSSPTSVSDTSMGLESLGVVGLRSNNELLELLNLTDLLESKDFILLVTVDS